MQNLEYFYSVGFTLAHPLIYLGNNRLKRLAARSKIVDHDCIYEWLLLPAASSVKSQATMHTTVMCSLNAAAMGWYLLIIEAYLTFLIKSLTAPNAVELRAVKQNFVSLNAWVYPIFVIQVQK